MSLSQIEYFVAVAEEGHVGRAAGKLRIAQPAVSRQIRRLEDELGTALFARTSRGMKLSRPGEVFLEHARDILQRVRVARCAVRQFGPAPSSIHALTASSADGQTSPVGGIAVP